jgi:hypothetical protein
MSSAAASVELLAHQQRAQTWLDRLAMELRARGLVPRRVGPVELDWFDGLRSPLNHECASVLAGSFPRSAVSPRVVAYRLALELDAATHFRPRAPLERVAGTVLVLPRLNGRHVIGIVRQLQKEHGHRILFLRTRHDREAYDHEFETVAVECFAGRRGRTVVLDVWRLARHIDAVLAGFEPTGFSARETRRLAHATRAVIRRDATTFWRTALGVETLVQESGARLLVVGNPCTIEGRAACLIARRRKLPVAGVEFGTVFAGDPRWYECPVDLMCAWGEPGRRAFVANGLPSERVVITGSALQDEMIARVPRKPAAERRVVLVATSGAGDKVTLDEHLRFIAVARQAAVELGDSRWIFKLHRKDRVEHYASLAGLPNVEIVPAQSTRFGVDIYDYLALAGALVTVQSTSAIDAMVMKVPVVSVDVDRRQRHEGAEFLRHTRVVHDAEELVRALRAALAETFDPIDESARDYLRRHFHHLGSACRVAASALEQLVSP